MTVSVHRRSLRAALAACTLLIAGACVPSGASTGPAPDTLADAGLETASWNAQSPAGEIAAWTRQGCRRAPGGRDACVERTLVGLIDQAGIAKSMEVLDTLTTLDAATRENAHALAHGLGIAAYRSPETLAATFSGCPVSQMSGCYHGVIQGYFLELSRNGRDIGTAEMDGLCDPHRASQFLYFQCAHGMGHGLMAVHENHVPMALDGCDRASDGFIRVSCYGGVFMENIVNVTHPHHTASGHAGTHGTEQQASAGEHAGHGAQAASEHAGHGAQPGHEAQEHDAQGGHGAATAATTMAHGEWKALDRNDWLYPCNAVAVKYQDSCYTMQTSAVMYFNYGDVAATARVCERAPASFQGTCFLSLGRDVSAFAGQDHQRSIEMCGRAGSTMGGRGGTWCMLGVVQTLVNQFADPQDGLRFCRAVSGTEAKGECYRVVGETIATLVMGMDARAESCRAAESGFVLACRRGAGLEPASVGGA